MYSLLSLPAWGAWIEILSYVPSPAATLGRSPHGGRGLKLRGLGHQTPSCGRSPHGGRGLKSYMISCLHKHLLRRSPHGGRGLKCQNNRPSWNHSRRSPHGGRGLKYCLPPFKNTIPPAVAPRMGGVD